MRRQPPIARCFAALCLGSGIALAAFEWRHPFPEAVVTLDAAPDISAASANLLPTASKADGKDRIWPFSRLSAEAKPTTVTEAAPVELALSLESRTLEVRVPGEPPVVYKVAVGQADWQTPTGDFLVLNKLENPAWQHPLTKEEIPPGPENPLGTHWIGFWTDGQAQIGFHGTNQEELIGEAVSHGCVRMKNADIAELYALVEVGTVVKVQL
ncbi:MAG: L,D-transpeptidase [Cyanobacteria bacterium J06597_16]